MDEFQLLQEARTTALSLTRAMLPFRGQSARGIPYIWVNAEGRPDITDLVRVYKQEGEGASESFWIYDLGLGMPPCIYLHILFTRPVKTKVFIAFPLPEQEELLKAIVLAKSLALLGETSEQSQTFLNDFLASIAHGAVIEAIQVRVNIQDLQIAVTHWREIVRRRQTS